MIDVSSSSGLVKKYSNWEEKKYLYFSDHQTCWIFNWMFELLALYQTWLSAFHQRREKINSTHLILCFTFCLRALRNWGRNKWEKKIHFDNLWSQLKSRTILPNVDDWLLFYIKRRKKKSDSQSASMESVCSLNAVVCIKKEKNAHKTSEATTQRINLKKSIACLGALIYINNKLHDDNLHLKHWEDIFLHSIGRYLYKMHKKKKYE